MGARVPTDKHLVFAQKHSQPNVALHRSSSISSRASVYCPSHAPIPARLAPTPPHAPPQLTTTRRARRWHRTLECATSNRAVRSSAHTLMHQPRTPCYICPTRTGLHSHAHTPAVHAHLKEPFSLRCRWTRPRPMQLTRACRSVLRTRSAEASRSVPPPPVEPLMPRALVHWQYELYTPARTPHMTCIHPTPAHDRSPNRWLHESVAEGLCGR